MVDQRYALIGVEGNHDQAFLCRILHKLLGFNKFDNTTSDLDIFWRKFVPIYPPKSGRLYMRLDMPTILYTSGISVAIYVGEGSKLITNLSAKLSDIDHSALLAFGIVADADKHTPSKVAEMYHAGFKEFFPNFPDKPGVLTKNSPRLGLHVLPDNSSQGVLDTLLCNCGKSAYPEFMQRAELYINQFSEEEIRRIGWKPFDREKAIVATVASVLKPGKTNTVSITDNNWVCSETVVAIPELSSILLFLKELLAIDDVVML
ncbi:MAG: hypothetical protein KME10_24125 [Plectolyngbya sp. WJT66-NPBG17]|jgi:hypothetical protein|nr:hypothetical protein [Plectolyngbya sp. WJT66-NPBG17]MBW4524440.1 hypothetical protein [Phormidium tanganyikae FI6-MK23]